MNEHPLLAQLAQLTGEFVATNNPSVTQLQEFQNSIATYPSVQPHIAMEDR
jgi:hypothetical protein